MTQDEVFALQERDKVGFKYYASEPIPASPATVVYHGPKLDPDGKPMVDVHGNPTKNDVLVIQLEGSSETVTWDVYGFPDGIPQLFPVL